MNLDFYASYNCIYNPYYMCNIILFDALVIAVYKHFNDSSLLLLKISLTSI
jgi:hypothetical protein